MSIPFASSYTIRTYTVGYDSNGQPSESGPTTQTIRATVTPLRDRDYIRMPEHMKVNARYKVRTQADLGDLGDRGETSSKRIVKGGREYQLDSWGDWDEFNFGGLKHNKYLASEISQ